MEDNIIYIEHKSLVSDPVLFFNCIISRIPCFQHDHKIVPIFFAEQPE